MYKLISTSNGIQLSQHSLPNVCKDDVLIETIASCYSKGTESSTVNKHQKSLASKIIANREKILDLVYKRNFNELFSKLKSQQESVINLGYSATGKVLAIGENVTNINVGDTVVAVGSSANHSQYSIIPKGLCVQIGDDVNPIDASASAIGSIALNSVHLAKPMLGSNSLVIGCGLLGQFLTQFLSISGANITCIDLEDWKLEQAKIHGANSCFTLDEFMQSKHSALFDSIYIVTPSLDNSLWIKIGDVTKYNAKIVMLGAADLNCPREVFYKKHLNFIAPHSYGPGRGLYEYEIMNNDFPDIANTWDIRSNIKLFNNLLASKKVSTSFLTRHVVDKSDSKKLIDILDSSSSYSVILDWSQLKKEQVITNHVNTIGIKPSDLNYKNIAINGFSDFAKQAHIPSIKKIDELIYKGVYNRSPIRKASENTLGNNEIQSKEIGTVVISNNHGSHSSSLIEMMKLRKFVVVDKPLCTSSEELKNILNAQEKYNSYCICFMSRRYSKHTSELQQYIDNRNGPFHLDCLFQVPHKDKSDPIYHEGGRLIGEMCHHVDLAIYLFGNPVAVHFIDNEKKSDIGLRENCSMLMSFQCGSSAHIRYTSIGNSEGIKEKIKLSFDDETLEIIDFQKTDLITKFKRKTIINEFDKGFLLMWEQISNIVNNKDLDIKKIAEMSDIDLTVTKILLRDNL